MFQKLKSKLHASSRFYTAWRRTVMCWRRWRYGLKYVDATFYVSPGCKISRDLVAHEYSFVNHGCVIGPKVELGRYVMLGPRVAIVGADHVINRAGTPIIFSGRPELKSTTIGDDAWLGYGAIIMAGVRIGQGAIVAAGAVIIKDVPPYEIHGGVPARKIGERFTDPHEKKQHEEMLAGPLQSGMFCNPKK